MKSKISVWNQWLLVSFILLSIVSLFVWKNNTTLNFELMILCCKLRHKVVSKTEGDPLIDNLASLVAQTKSICLQCRRPGFRSWVGKIPWRRKRQPSPVLLPGKSHGLRSLVGYSQWGSKSRTQLSDFTFTLMYTSSSLFYIKKKDAKIDVKVYKYISTL